MRARCSAPSRARSRHGSCPAQPRAVVRAINGATRPHEAAPGTIRGDFALETAQNIVHASDSAETAASELELWFDAAELHEYARDIDRWVLAPEE